MEASTEEHQDLQLAIVPDTQIPAAVDTQLTTKAESQVECLPEKRKGGRPRKDTANKNSDILS